MVYRKEVIDPRLDPRFDCRRLELFVTEVGQILQLVDRVLEAGQARLQFVRVATRQRVVEVGLNFQRQVLLQRLDAVYARLDVVQSRLLDKQKIITPNHHEIILLVKS